MTRTFRPAGRLGLLCLLLAYVCPPLLTAQQVADTAYSPNLGQPAFPSGEGPRIAVDGGHGNFHTVDGRYQPFAKVLAADGFVVEGLNGVFSPTALQPFKLLVIANALHPKNQSDWSLDTPSAFTEEEIRTVREWVESGGALLLVADHMPFPGASADLAAAFGFELNNGFALDTTSEGPFVFRRTDGSLAPHPIVTTGERIDSVATFTGSAFRPPEGAVCLLTLPEGIVSLMPETAWEFDSDTPVVEVGGWAQGALLEVGKGRIAVFGEAAMFSAQRGGAGGTPMGMNASVASQNALFLVKLVRWLVAGDAG